MTTRVLPSALPHGILPRMAQQPVELILIRHLGSRLAIPVFVIDADGNMVYFNGPAGRILGRDFDEISVMPLAAWTTVFLPSANGRRLETEEIPLVQALRQANPIHGTVEITGADGVARTISVTAFPLVAPTDQVLGAVAMFWESEPS
jgi:PAS domain-containing protein